MVMRPLNRCCPFYLHVQYPKTQILHNNHRAGFDNNVDTVLLFACFSQAISLLTSAVLLFVVNGSELQVLCFLRQWSKNCSTLEPKKSAG